MGGSHLRAADGIWQSNLYPPKIKGVVRSIDFFQSIRPLLWRYPTQPASQPSSLLRGRSGFQTPWIFTDLHNRVGCQKQAGQPTKKSLKTAPPLLLHALQRGIPSSEELRRLGRSPKAKFHPSIFSEPFTINARTSLFPGPELTEHFIPGEEEEEVFLFYSPTISREKREDDDETLVSRLRGPRGAGTRAAGQDEKGSNDGRKGNHESAVFSLSLPLSVSPAR